MPDTMDQARRLLQHHFGYPDFRPAQTGVIRSILAGQDTLAILPTGGGKSICFQVPAMVIGGLTIVVSPLIALMQDQVAAAVARGIPAAGLHSSLEEAEKEEIWAALRAGTLRLLYSSPERLSSLAPQLHEKRIHPTLLAIDEAHCVTEWGHDFRPSYRTLGASRYRLGGPPCLALTGSATAEVRADIASVMRFRPGRFATHLGSFDRSNLWFGVVRVRSERDRLRALLGLVGGDDQMVIVYAPTRGLTESVTRALARAGHRAAPYHAGLPKARRAATLRDFLEDRVDVIVATCAFGLGIDKPDVRLVVHWTLPATPEAYYQEAGRAGRDGAFARCVLLWRQGDAELHRRQLEVTFPPRAVLEKLWNQGETRGVAENVQASAERLRRELRPESGPIDWSGVQERRRRAEARIAAVETYASGKACRRRALLGYFGERLERCAGCDRCGPARAVAAVNPVVAARLGALRREVGGRRGPWGGALLEPDVLLRLAERPPSRVGELAEVPGVGAALAESLGGTILRALNAGAGSGKVKDAPPPLRQSLERWRSRTAASMGVPGYRILSDVAIEALASGIVGDRSSLARLPGVGPRTLAKFGEELLRLVSPA
ncbi:MAG: RecQ family ATP-dependent DNA helicase [Gemmatimonadales bacterium]